MMWLVLAIGCDLTEIVDQIDGITNPLVTEALVLGVAEPADERIDLSSIGYDPGANATVFLANASNVNDLDNALVSGATVTASDGPTSAELPERENGVYVSNPGSGLDYVPGRTMTISAVLDDRSGSGALELPEGAGLGIMEDHMVGEPIEVDVTGKGYTGSLIVVFDTTSGRVTYSNEPTDARGVYDLTRGTTELTMVTIPGKAFPDESVYALGFAGLVHTGSDDFEGLNTLLSGMVAGQLEFYPVVTVPLP
ncbi:MAG: hypothetical protein AAGA48_20960 [Myxococcota bacterium]